MDSLIIAIYTCKASGVIPEFNSEYSGYTVNETNNGDGTYTTEIYTDDINNLPTKISFSGQSSLLSVEKVNTSNVTNMGLMFYNCSSLTSLDVSGWNTNKVTIMSNMFNNCYSLTSLDVSGWDTGNVTDMGAMIYNCSSLTSLDVSGWNTDEVTNMSYMFYNCSSLTSLDVSGWNTEKVTNMWYMFFNCSSLTSLDVSGWDTGNVTDMFYMFRSCGVLTSLNISGWDVSNVTNIAAIFEYCKSLTSLDMSNWNTSNINNTSYMFNGCTALTSLDVSGWDVGKVTTMSNMFQNCSSLTSLDLSSWNTGNMTNMALIFFNCSSLTSLDVRGWNADKVSSTPSMFYNCTSLTSVFLNDSSAYTINHFITNLLEKTADSHGTIFVSNIDQVDTSLANSKYWDIVLVVESFPDGPIRSVACGIKPVKNMIFGLNNKIARISAFDARKHADLVRDGLYMNIYKIDPINKTMTNDEGDMYIDFISNSIDFHDKYIYVHEYKLNHSGILIPDVSFEYAGTISYVVDIDWTKPGARQFVCGIYTETFYFWLDATRVNMYYQGYKWFNDEEYTTAEIDNARFIDITYDETAVRLYINGVLKIEKLTTGVLIRPTTSKQYLDSNMGMNSIAEYKLYSYKLYHKALTPDEILQNIEYEKARIE